MIRWIALAPALLVAAPGEQDQAQERFYDLRRKIFAEISEAFGRAGDASASQKDFEAASLLHSIAAALGRKDAPFSKRWEEDLRRVREGIVFRSASVSATACGRDCSQRLKPLGRLAAELRLSEQVAPLEVLEKEFEMLAGILETVRRLNDFRAAARLAPVGLSQELTLACMWHCRYMVLADDYGHDERAGSMYYTEDGEKAGKASCLAPAPAVPHAVDMHMASLYHRIPFLQPGLQAIGAGAWPAKDKLLTAIDAKRMAVPTETIVIYPSNNQRNVPPVFLLGEAGESPNPLPNGEDSAGQPITLTFYGEMLQQLQEAEGLKVTLLDPSGREVPCHMSSPSRPANGRDRTNGRSVCAIPMRPLKKKATYRAVFEMRLDGRPQRFETTFTTGEK